MTVLAGEVVSRQFTVTDPATAAAVNADSLPTAVLVQNGVDTAESVVITNVETGVYKLEVTIPSSYADGDEVEVRVTAVVGGVTGKGIVWFDSIVAYSGGIPGIAVVPTGTVLLSELRDEVQVRLGDSGGVTWPDATIEEWLNAAIRVYSQHLPRTVEATIAVLAGVQEYALGGDFQSMVRVEYPDAQTPPEYLKQAEIDGSGNFWGLPGYYAVTERQAAGYAAEIWLADSPAANGTLRCWYLADHDFNLASGDTLTVPERHHEVLVLYVLWQASLERQAIEEASPTSNSSLLMAQLAQNAWRRERAFYTALAEAKKETMGKTAVVQWLPRGYEEIY